MTSRLHRTIVVCTAACLLAAGGCRRQSNQSPRSARAAAQESRQLRRTPLVDLYNQCRGVVVNIRTITEVATDDGPIYQNSWGAGWMLHPAGYIITTEHVIESEGSRMVVMPNGEHYECRVIVRYPPLDIALLRIDADEPFEAATIGRSNDLMIGELAATIGSPEGLWETFSVGIVSGVGRVSAASDSYMYSMIQTDAGINKGNSGGPLLNALGEVIGIVDGMKSEAENIGFAIDIDQLRQHFSVMLSPEMRYGFVLGLEVDPLAPEARVTVVAEGSPAEAAGIMAGDIITRVGQMNVRHGPDFYLALIDQHAGEELPMTLTRSDRLTTVVVPLGTANTQPAVQAEGLTNGLKYEAFIGRWDQLPAFEDLSPVSVGQVDTVALTQFNQTISGFGLRLTGYLNVPAEGLYTFLLTSDDGSQLYIGDRLIVDNDYAHMPQCRHGLIRLREGMHPITVLFFDRSGGKALDLKIEGPGLERQSIPTSMLFSNVPSEGPEVIDVPVGDPPD